MIVYGVGEVHGWLFSLYRIAFSDAYITLGKEVGLVGTQCKMSTHCSSGLLSPSFLAFSSTLVAVTLHLQLLMYSLQLSGLRRFHEKIHFSSRSKLFPYAKRAAISKL